MSNTIPPTSTTVTAPIATTPLTAKTATPTPPFKLPDPALRYVDGRQNVLNTPIVPSSLLQGVTPQQNFVIKDGTNVTRGKTVKLPFTFSGSGMLASGVVDAEKLAGILKKHGVEPLPIEQYPAYAALAPFAAARNISLQGKAVVEIYGNNYSETSAGPIKPCFLVAYVKNPRPDIKDPKTGAPPAVGIIFLEYIANTEMARDFGIEAWGFEKLLGETQDQFDNGPDRSFRASYQGQPILTMDIKNAEQRLNALPAIPAARSALLAISPKGQGWGPGQTFNLDEVNAGYRITPFDPEHDTFDPQGFLKNNLAAMGGFTAIVWAASDGFEGIFHTDLSQVPEHKHDPVTVPPAPTK